MTEQEKRLHRCCFTGHRPEKLFLVDREIIKELEREIKAAIERGYTTFISGMARGVDIWAAEIVLKLRKQNKDLHLICASPYEGFEARWSQDWQKRYKKIIKKSDYVKYVSPEYSPACFQIRNEYMVDHSNLLIAVYNGEAGGTRNTINYAKKKDIEIIVVEGQLIIEAQGIYSLGFDFLFFSNFGD